MRAAVLVSIALCALVLGVSAQGDKPGECNKWETESIACAFKCGSGNYRLKCSCKDGCSTVECKPSKVVEGGSSEDLGAFTCSVSAGSSPTCSAYGSIEGSGETGCFVTPAKRIITEYWKPSKSA